MRGFDAAAAPTTATATATAQHASPAAALLQAAFDGCLRAAVRCALAARGEPARLLLGRLAAERAAAAPGATTSPGVLGYVLHRLTAGLLSGAAPPPGAYAGAVAEAVLERAREGDGDALATPAGLLLLAPGLAGAPPPPPPQQQQQPAARAGAPHLAAALAALPEPALLDQLAALWAVGEGRARAAAPPAAALAALAAHCEAALLASAAAHACGAPRAAADAAPHWFGGEALGWALQA